MCAIRLAWYGPCERIGENVKMSFHNIKNMKPMFHIGAQTALFWGGRHQNAMPVLP
jgi:hypothetical protein